MRHSTAIRTPPHYRFRLLIRRCQVSRVRARCRQVSRRGHQFRIECQRFLLGFQRFLFRLHATMRIFGFVVVPLS